MIEILDTVVLKELVSHPVMKEPNEPVIPGLAWRDKCLDRPILTSPGAKIMSDELWPVIHPDHPWTPTIVETGKVEQLDHGARVDFLVDREGHVLASVFIDNVADLDRLTMPGRIKLEIQCLYITRILARRNLPVSITTQALALLAKHDTKAFFTPDTPEGLPAHPKPIGNDLYLGTPVSPPSMILSELVHPRTQARILIGQVITGSSAPISATRESNNLTRESL